MVIDTSNWKEFRVKDLFPPCKVTKLTKKPQSEGENEFITSSSYNNGVSAFCGEETIKGNCITVSTNGKCFDCFYHKNRIVVCNDVEVLYSPFLNEYNGLFICSVLKQEQKKYNFTDKPKNGKVFDTITKLPATPDGEPDWQYMESYMKKIMQESEQSIENLNRVEDKKDSIDISSWMPFKVSDIFVTEKHGTNLQVPTGAMMSKKNLEDGNIPRVTVSNYNNGITGYYSDSNNKNYRTYENFISVSFLGTVFYQPKKTSLDMKVHCLKPLNYELNVYSAMFIVSIIRNAILKFAYSDQLSSATLTELEFSLPTTFNGEPDWQYMENYMKKIIEESEQIISELQVVTSDNHVIEEKSETIKKDCLDKDKAILEEFLQFCNRK